MAELTRAYSNFRIPPLDVIVNSAMSVHATLVQQSEGLSPLVPAIDANRSSPTGAQHGRTKRRS